jgi:predicted nuclease with RNAse H fold
MVSSFGMHGNFMRGFAGAPAGPNEPVDWHAGDVYLSLDLNMRALPETEPLMRELARRGIRLCFLGL